MGTDLPAGPVVQARGLTKSFRDVRAVDDVSFEVHRGEIVVLLGTNGAGKSTLMRMVGTRIVPDAGEVVVSGAPAAGAPELVRRRTGVVLAEERSFYWRLTGRANLEFFGRLSGLGRRACRERVRVLLDAVDLVGEADRRFDGYSSGMRARLALARALLLDPPVLLLDEPSRALDPGAAARLRTLVLARCRDLGTAVLWVTHDLHEAAEVADHVLVLSSGRVVTRSGPPGSAASLSVLLDLGPGVA